MDLNPKNRELLIAALTSGNEPNPLRDAAREVAGQLPDVIHEKWQAVGIMGVTVASVLALREALEASS